MRKSITVKRDKLISSQSFAVDVLRRNIVPIKFDVAVDFPPNIDGGCVKVMIESKKNLYSFSIEKRVFQVPSV